MNIIFDFIQFIETSLLFSASLFAVIMFIRTKDALALRTLMVLLPVSALLLISYMYSLAVRSGDVTHNGLSWLTPLFALLVIALIMLSILATCYYVIKLFPIPAKRKRIGFIFCAALVGVLLIVTAILVMYISRADLTQSIANALWAFYPLCSLALFVEAVALAVMFRHIKSPHERRMAQYFLIAFLPQIAYSVLDFILLRDIAFQLTHLSYATFSLFAFIDLSAYFFKYYGRDIDISAQSRYLKQKYQLTDREFEVAELLAQGMPNAHIGEKLHISVNTVKSHIKSIYRKLHIANRLQLINLLGGNGGAHNSNQ